VQVLSDPNYRLYYGEALRSLLIVATRVTKNPAEALKHFKEVTKSNKLPEEDSQEVERWTASLEAWAKEGKQPEPSLARAEKLITAGLTKGIDYNRDDVSLLRGTAMLHSLLEREGVTPEERRRGLYLLGLAYSDLPMFFTAGWAEMYLEQCINEFLATDEARKAFRAYKSRVVDDFTGSGGTDIPAEVQLHLDELRRKAYGEPAVNGRV
jgi:hypothetical protein